MQIADRVVIVTGASSGIGWATALHLAAKGASVFAAARNLERLEALAELSPRITPVRCDVTVDDDRAALVAAAGPVVDVLVNNAGLGYVGPVERMAAGDVRTVFETNVLALVDLTQRVLPGMLERRRGHVVNMASVASWVGFPPYSVYGASKFAIQGFTEGLRREVIGRGVTVASINPGPIVTEFHQRASGADATGPTTWLSWTSAGPGTGLVARAVARSIRLRHVPGYQVIAVPRLVGLARVGAVPGLARVVDLISLPSRRAGR